MSIIQVRLNECRIVIKENGMEITKSGVKLCPEVIGFYHRILEVRRRGRR